MIIGIVTEASDHGIRTYSAPATEIVGQRGSLTLWPGSEKPIRVPYAWLYRLRFRDTEEGADG